MYTRHYLLYVTITAALLSAQEAPSVQVTGLLKQTMNVTAADLAKMPRATVKTALHGKEAVYDGVWISEILKRVGVPQGNDLRGRVLSGAVVAQAKDEYQVLFSLAELDPAFIDSQVLLADTMNGKPLDAEQGPFRLIALKDKPGARSIRMLTKLDVVLVRK